MPRPGSALFALAILGLDLAGTAWAADLPAKAFPYQASFPGSGWTGFYVGGDLGGAWMTQDAAWNPLPSPAAFLAFPVTGRLEASHFVGSLHGGYDWQLAPTWVIGIEGDYSWTRTSASTEGIWNVFPIGGPVPGSLSSLSSTLDSLSSVRGRLGYLVTRMHCSMSRVVRPGGTFAMKPPPSMLQRTTLPTRRFRRPRRASSSAAAWNGRSARTG